MKKISTGLAMLLVALAIIGCDHSSNNVAPPAEAGVSVASPTANSWVEGTVNLDVELNGLKPMSVEYYIDGQLFFTRWGGPWAASWDVSSLPSNSSHTIRAVAYTESYAFTSSKEITVKKK